MQQKIDVHELKRVARSEYLQMSWLAIPYCFVSSRNVGEVLQSAALFYSKRFETNKDRLTVDLCSNATGTHKLPLFVIGKSIKYRVFKNDIFSWLL